MSPRQLLAATCGLVLFTTRGLLGQAVFRGCPLAGNAEPADVQALNVLKNRTTVPSTSDIDPAVTLTTMLQPGDDRGRWSDQRAAVIVGYVEEVKPGPKETVNCGATRVEDKDTHIALVLDPMNGGGQHEVIVEVTPRMRAIAAQHGLDWSTKALKKDYLGRWVRVAGWLLFDAEHAAQAENTAPGRAKDWRATAWELHPITSIEVTARPR